jgi:hypothetical protein
MQRLMNAKGQSIKSRMKNILLLFLIAATATHCSKSKESGSGHASIEGDWELKMHRSDPGDGSGTWRDYTGEPAYIVFYPDGTFFDKRRNLFNRYSISGDTITLSNSANSNTFQLAIQELTDNTLSYYYGWPWCGGPSGEKFVRLPRMYPNNN